MTRVFLSTRILIRTTHPTCRGRCPYLPTPDEGIRGYANLSSSCCRHYFFRRILHRLCDDKIESGLLKYFPSLLDVCSFEAQNDGKLKMRFSSRLNHSTRQRVHAKDAAENINQHRLHVLIA